MGLAQTTGKPACGRSRVRHFSERRMDTGSRDSGTSLAGHELIDIVKQMFPMDGANSRRGLGSVVEHGIAIVAAEVRFCPR